MRAFRMHDGKWKKKVGDTCKSSRAADSMLCTLTRTPVLVLALCVIVLVCCFRRVRSEHHYAAGAAGVVVSNHGAPMVTQTVEGAFDTSTYGGMVPDTVKTGQLSNAVSAQQYEQIQPGAQVAEDKLHQAFDGAIEQLSETLGGGGRWRLGASNVRQDTARGLVVRRVSVRGRCGCEGEIYRIDGTM